MKLREMKLLVSILTTAALLLAPAPRMVDGATNAAKASRVVTTNRDEDERDDAETLWRSIAATADVVVTLCVNSGNVVVRGWDQREVRARSSEAAQLELLDTKSPKPPPPVIPGISPVPPVPPQVPTPNMPASPNTPATAPLAANLAEAAHVEVLLANSEGEDLNSGDCQASANAELYVPRGATIILRVRHGDVDVEGLAEARIESLSGDTDIRRVTKAVEVTSFSGDIVLDETSGPVRLRTISGDIEVKDARALNSKDPLTVKTTSGDVNLESIAHALVEASAVSGDVQMTGGLARGGRYDFKTTSGNVILILPANASFKLNARIIVSGEIINAFPFQAQSDAPPSTEPQAGRLVGTVGTGDAELNLSSFKGTLQLKKQ